MSQKFRFGQKFIKKLGISLNFINRCLHSFAQYCTQHFIVSSFIGFFSSVPVNQSQIIFHCHWVLRYLSCLQLMVAMNLCNLPITFLLVKPLDSQVSSLLSVFHVHLYIKLYLSFLSLCFGKCSLLINLLLFLIKSCFRAILNSNLSQFVMRFSELS